MLERHLKQPGSTNSACEPGSTNSACGPFTKSK